MFMLRNGNFFTYYQELELKNKLYEKQNQMTEKEIDESVNSELNQTEPGIFKEKDLMNQINDLKKRYYFLITR